MNATENVPWNDDVITVRVDNPKKPRILIFQISRRWMGQRYGLSYSISLDVADIEPGFSIDAALSIFFVRFNRTFARTIAKQ
jgi:hypothetical protein